MNSMQRQRGELVPVGEVIADLPGPVQAVREASPQALPSEELRPWQRHSWPCRFTMSASLRGTPTASLLACSRIRSDRRPRAGSGHGRREDGCDLERHELGVGGLTLGLELLEDLVVLDGVVD